MAVKIGIMSFAHMHSFSYASAINRNPNAILVGVADHDAARGKEMGGKVRNKVLFFV